MTGRNSLIVLKDKNLKRDICQKTWFQSRGQNTLRKSRQGGARKGGYDDPKDVFARIEALEAQFAAKQKEFKEKYL